MKITTFPMLKKNKNKNNKNNKKIKKFIQIISKKYFHYNYF